MKRTNGLSCRCAYSPLLNCASASPRSAKTDRRASKSATSTTTHIFLNNHGCPPEKRKYHCCCYPLRDDATRADLIESQPFRVFSLPQSSCQHISVRSMSITRRCCTSSLAGWPVQPNPGNIGRLRKAGAATEGRLAPRSRACRDASGHPARIARERKSGTILRYGGLHVPQA